jgi:cell division protein FtsW
MCLVLILSVAGAVLLASASTVRGLVIKDDASFFLKRQLLWLAVGGAAGGVAACCHYRRWRRAASLLAVLSIGLLVFVLIFGREINGSRRWLHLGPLSFQPSELAKLGTILMLAAWFRRIPLRIGKLREGIILPGLVLGLVLLLVLKEPDVGTTALIAAVGGIMFFCAGADKRWLTGLAVAGAALLCLYVRCDPHRWELVQAWWNPAGHEEVARQSEQAKKAFMMGGVRGTGLTESMQKQLYLPEVHTDFILAVVGEELGLAGSCLVLALFAGVLFCGAVISINATDFFGYLLGWGITVAISLQAIFNVAVVTGSIPTKGIALPFFSYGGSGLLVSLIECGILVSIGRVAVRSKSRQEGWELAAVRPGSGAARLGACSGVAG